jgi:hypothetical protein
MKGKKLRPGDLLRKQVANGMLWTNANFDLVEEREDSGIENIGVGTLALVITQSKGGYATLVLLCDGRVGWVMSYEWRHASE